MFRRLIIFMMLICAATSLQGGIWDKIKTSFLSSNAPQEPKIKVLVLHDQDRATLEVKGNYNIYDPYLNSKLATRFTGKSNRITALPTGLKWGEEFPGTYQLHIVPDHQSTVTVINGIAYRGSIYVYDIGGSISIVNEVNIEDYLASLLPNKFDRPLSEEGLAAATIAERTHAYYLSTHGENPFWQVHAQDVGYNGVQAENSNPMIAEAIGSTRFMVMSQTGIYDGMLTPFPVEIAHAKPKNPQQTVASLSIDEVEEMANRGDNAARILARKFPNTSIEMMHANPMPREHVAEVNLREYRAPKPR